MLRKLNLASKTPLLRLAFKALIFSGLLAWAGLGEKSFFPVLVFVLTAVFIYFLPVLNWRRLFSSFLVLLAVSFLFIIGQWPAVFGQALAVAVIAAFGFVFFLILGIKNLIFVERSAFYYLLSNLLFFLVFLFFFSRWSLADSPWFIVGYLLMFAVVFFLQKEFLAFLVVESPSRRLLISAGFAFIILQLVWAISYLPVGFLNSAALALPLVFVLGDFTIHHFGGSLNRRVVLRNATILIAIIIVISAVSCWSL